MENYRNLLLNHLLNKYFGFKGRRAAPGNICFVFNCSQWRVDTIIEYSKHLAVQN